jgi:vacuolar-type H+-ATPase subunit H
MKELKSVQEELRDCVNRFEGVSVGSLVWCCHHEELLEILCEPAQERIEYIMRYKPPSELARRLFEFRPVLSELPESVEKAWEKAWEAREKAREKAREAREKAREAGEKEREAREAWEKAREAGEKEREAREADKECSALLLEIHLREVPDTSWTSCSIFDKERSE